MASIGERIKEFRKQKHFTQTELGKRVSLSSQVISNYERGYSTPSADDISNIAKALEIPVSSLYASTNSELHSEMKDSGVPDWATDKDVIDLDKMLQSNVPMGFGGMEWSQEDKKKIRNVLVGLYWDQLKELRDKGQK